MNRKTSKWDQVRRLAFVAALGVASGCTTQLGQFTIYTPKSIDLSTAEYQVVKTKKVVGVDSANLYLVFPSNAISYDQAVRNAMAKQSGCVGLADVTLRRKAFWLLFGYCDFEAEGYPIIKKEAK